jgi:hypothetical protein
MMTRFTSALLFASFTAAFSRDSPKGTFKKALHQNANDMVTLLQGEMHMATEKHSGAKADLDEAPMDANQACKSFAAGTRSVSSTTCTDKARKVETPVIGLEIANSSPSEERIAAATSHNEANGEDPPGANILKIVLEIGIVFLFVDGVRRWRLQQQEASKDKQSNFAEEDAAADRAWEALVKAAAAGDAPKSKKALQQGASVKREDAWGCTPLHFAANGGSTEVTNDLLHRGAEVDALDACDETALHLAARAGHAGVCEVLVNKGANINAINAQDMTPLVVAGHAKQVTTCRFLADHGASAGGMADEDLPMLVVSQLVRKVVEGTSELK